MAEKKTQFKPARRLRSPRQFEDIYQRGARVHCSTFVLYGMSNPLGYHRLGITISRRIGGAVVRNRVKRRLREIFRTKLKPSGLGIDMIVNAKHPIVLATFLQIQREFLDGLDQLRRRLGGSSTDHEGSSGGR